MLRFAESYKTSSVRYIAEAYTISKDKWSENSDTCFTILNWYTIADLRKSMQNFVTVYFFCKIRI
jgi:hypothetical protein